MDTDMGRPISKLWHGPIESDNPKLAISDVADTILFDLGYVQAGEHSSCHDCLVMSASETRDYGFPIVGGA